MSHYILKTFDSRGRLVDRFEFGAPDDREAEGAVDDLAERRVAELWCGRRWVRTWAPPIEAVRSRSPR